MKLRFSRVQSSSVNPAVSWTDNGKRKQNAVEKEDGSFILAGV